MKTLATIGDNCVDIYPQLNKAFSGGNAVNVAVYCTRYGIQPGCITWVGDDDYGTKLKQDLARMGVDISHVHTKHGVTAQTQVELHDNDRVFGDYTEGVMADFALSEEDYAWLAQYDIVHAAIWGHAEDAFPQLHAAGKLTAFDFSDKWDSPLWQTLVPHLDFAFASAPQEDETLRLKMKAIVARGAGTVIVTLFRGYAIQQLQKFLLFLLCKVAMGFIFYTFFVFHNSSSFLSFPSSVKSARICLLYL